MKKQIVYVTGCLGFIGSYVTRECLKRGWFVRGIDKCTYASNEKLLEEFNQYENFVFEKKDINDIEFLYECDYVINVAAETHVGNSIVKSDDFVHSNINGVHHLLELIRNYRAENKEVPTMLHFSTDEVYGDIDEGAHVEDDLLKPSNVEKLIPKACKYLMVGRKIPLHNNGTPIRNWLHAQDTANAVMTIIESGVENEIYNICGGFEQDNLTTVQKLVKLYNGDEDYQKYLDLSISRPGQDMRYALDDSKLQALGWKAKGK